MTTVAARRPGRPLGSTSPSTDNARRAVLDFVEASPWQTNLQVQDSVPSVTAGQVCAMLKGLVASGALIRVGARGTFRYARPGNVARACSTCGEDFFVVDSAVPVCACMKRRGVWGAGTRHPAEFGHWKSMMTRCYSPNTRGYPKGIRAAEAADKTCAVCASSRAERRNGRCTNRVDQHTDAATIAGVRYTSAKDLYDAITAYDAVVTP